jgi:phosphoribosyl 1,2-cyclic phosphodiesterase
VRFAYLGSGSQGNGLVVQAGATTLLLDCGFPVADTVRRLARLGLAPGDLSGILVTHEHTDHIGGVPAFARRFALPVWLSHGTLRGTGLDFRGLRVEMLEGFRRFPLGDLAIEPYPVPHDAGEPVQYVFGDGRVRFGVLTDAGSVTPHIRSMLTGCDALALECNHDVEMLSNGPYPPGLKRRVAGAYGHLSNVAAADLLASLDRSRLRQLVAVHLSLKNNTVDLARQALAGVIGCAPEWIGVADQFEGLDWRDVGSG